MFTFNKKHYAIWLFASLLYAFQLVLRMLPGVMMNDIIVHFGMNAAQFGILSACYYITYSAAQIPIGIMLDNFPPRNVIFGGTILSVLGLSCFIFSNNLYFAYLGRVFIGMGAGVGILGAVKTIDDFFKESYGFMVGLVVVVGIMGSFLINYPPILNAINSSGIEVVFSNLCWVGLFIGLVIFILYRNDKNDLAKKTEESIFYGIKECLKNKNLWILGVIGGLMIGPMEGFADAWGVNYLQNIHNLSKEQAVFAITLIIVSFGFSAPIIGQMILYFKNNSLFFIFCSLMMLTSFVILFNVNNRFLLYLSLILLGAFSSYQVALVTVAANLASNYVALSTAMVNMLMMSFGTIFHILIGQILNRFFSPVISDGLYSFDEMAYLSAFSVIIIALFLSIIFCVIFKKRIG